MLAGTSCDLVESIVAMYEELADAMGAVCPQIGLLFNMPDNKVIGIYTVDSKKRETVVQSSGTSRGWR